MAACILSASGCRTKALNCGEQSQRGCVKPFERTRIPDNSSSAPQDRLEVRVSSRVHQHLRRAVIRIRKNSSPEWGDNRIGDNNRGPSGEI